MGRHSKYLKNVYDNMRNSSYLSGYNFSTGYPLLGPSPLSLTGIYDIAAQSLGYTPVGTVIEGGPAPAFPLINVGAPPVVSVGNTLANLVSGIKGLAESSGSGSSSTPTYITYDPSTNITDSGDTKYKATIVVKGSNIEIIGTQTQLKNIFDKADK